MSPFFIPAALINLASGQVSIRFGFKGPNHAVVTACSTGAHAIGDAARLIALDDADVMVAGGAEAAICRIGIAGFAAARALSTGFNDTPEKASRPWDKDRDGFVMGEGAGVVVLEEFEHAKARGAKIYAEIIGYGMSGDAYHITAPAEDGNGGIARHAGGAEARAARPRGHRLHQRPRHLDAARRRDRAAARSKRLFGEAAYKLSMSSTKSAIGHLLGAAGASRRSSRILAIRDQVVPPTLNLDNPVARLRHRPGAEAGQAAQGPGRAVQLLRLRRHQRQPDLHRRPLRPLMRQAASACSCSLPASSRSRLAGAAVSGVLQGLPRARAGWRRHHRRDRRRAARLRGIADKLADAGVITDPLVFVVGCARLSAKGGRCRPASTCSRPGPSPREIMDS